MTEPQKARVLIVDDDRDHVAFLAELIAEHAYDVETATSGLEALDAFSRAPADVVVTDVHMPGMDGVQLITMLTMQRARPALIAITAFGSLDTATRVLRAGAADYLSKPFQPFELLESIERAIARRAWRLRQLKLQDEVDEVLRKRRR